MHESIVWTQRGRFDSHHLLLGRRLRRDGCLVATPWRLLFVSIRRRQIQLESITLAQIEDIGITRAGWYQTLSFSASGNPCRLRCRFTEPLDLHVHWLRQRTDAIQTSLAWHNEAGPAASKARPEQGKIA